MIQLHTKTVNECKQIQNLLGKYWFYFPISFHFSLYVHHFASIKLSLIILCGISGNGSGSGVIMRDKNN